MVCGLNTKESFFNIEIQNLVVIIDLKIAISFVKLSLAMDEDIYISYLPMTFPGMVLKPNQPRSSILLFSTGRAVITGIKKMQDITEVTNFLAQVLEKSGQRINKEKIEVKIGNIVATGGFYDDSSKKTHTIDLELTALTFDNVFYEPEQFPGAIIRLSDPQVVILLFQTGNVVITGAKEEKDITTAMISLYKMLNEYECFSDHS